MLSPATPERVRELVGRANQELRWAIGAEGDLRGIATCVNEVKLILKSLILPLPPYTPSTSPHAVEFVNGTLPTTAFRQERSSRGIVSIQQAGDTIAPGEVVPLHQSAESYGRNETFYGTERLIGVSAMMQAVQLTGKLQINPDGIDDWVEAYKQAVAQAAYA